MVTRPERVVAIGIALWAAAVCVLRYGTGNVAVSSNVEIVVLTRFIAPLNNPRDFSPWSVKITFLLLINYLIPGVINVCYESIPYSL